MEINYLKTRKYRYEDLEKDEEGYDYYEIFEVDYIDPKLIQIIK